MAIKTISQFESAVPAANDMILFEQNGEGKSATLVSLPVSTSVRSELSQLKSDLANISDIDSYGGDLENGYWIKFKNGLAIWNISYNFESLGSDWVSWGNYFKEYKVNINITLPFAFTEYSATATINNRALLFESISISRTSVNHVFVCRPSDQVSSSGNFSGSISIQIIGKWK